MTLFLLRRAAPATAVAASSLAAAYCYNHTQDSRSECEAKSTPCPPKDINTTTDKDHNMDTPKLIFLGTGSSTGCPKPLCAMVFHQKTTVNKHLTPEQQAFRDQLESMCRVSNMAIHPQGGRGDPRDNKNYRNNPSFLIHHYDESDTDTDNGNDKDNEKTGTMKNIVIDVGKTFREGALRWFPQYQIASLDAIVLTHHHMDAAGGLDDIRGFQKLVLPPLQHNPSSTSTSTTTPTRRTGPPSRIPIPVYMSQFCFDNLSDQFPWLLPKPEKVLPKMDDSKPVVKRDVASLDVGIFKDLQPFTTQGLEIVPLPVWHGDDLLSHGFAFSVRGKRSSGKRRRTNVVYLSDISRMVPETLEFILETLPQPTDILVIDSLLWHKDNPVHFSLDQAMALRDKIQPKQTYLVGTNCDSFLPHDEMNVVLKKEYGSVQLAYDGQVIELE
jgi:phosphoribosyl 1,2-cyclic phosphodiesterase